MKINIGPYPNNDKKVRKVQITTDNYDFFNLDHTLALIIHPCLVRFKSVKAGIPYIDDKDLPTDKGLRFDEGNERDTLKLDRWNYVLDEMIWAFEWIISEDHMCCTDQSKYTRFKEAMRLFGIYYTCLWI